LSNSWSRIRRPSRHHRPATKTRTSKKRGGARNSRGAGSKEARAETEVSTGRRAWGATPAGNPSRTGQACATRACRVQAGPGREGESSSQEAGGKGEAREEGGCEKTRKEEAGEKRKEEVAGPGATSVRPQRPWRT